MVYRFYVDSVLEHAGVEGVAVCAVGCEGEPHRLRYTYPYGTETCWEWGNCKCHVLEQSRSESDVKTVMIGDGWSDYCAARLADAAFARATMRDHCDANGVPYHPLRGLPRRARRLPRGDSRRVGAAARARATAAGLICAHGGDVAKALFGALESPRYALSAMLS